MMSDIVNTSEQEKQTKPFYPNLHLNVKNSPSVPFCDKLSHVPLNRKNANFKGVYAPCY